MWMKICWLEKCPLSYISWRFVGRRMIVVIIWRKECMIDGSRCFSFEIINLCVSFLCSVYIHVLWLMFQMCWCWKCSVCQGRFPKLKIWKKCMCYGGTRVRSVCLWYSFYQGGLHSLIVWMIYLWVFIHSCLCWNLYM